ncbi:hypothetical protein AAC387_Pa02g2478 [Persea americana]
MGKKEVARLGGLAACGALQGRERWWLAAREREMLVGSREEKGWTGKRIEKERDILGHGCKHRRKRKRGKIELARQGGGGAWWLDGRVLLLG